MLSKELKEKITDYGRTGYIVSTLSDNHKYRFAKGRKDEDSALGYGILFTIPTVMISFSLFATAAVWQGAVVAGAAALSAVTSYLQCRKAGKPERDFDARIEQLVQEGLDDGRLLKDYRDIVLRYQEESTLKDDFNTHARIKNEQAQIDAELKIIHRHNNPLKK